MKRILRYNRMMSLLYVKQQSGNNTNSISRDIVFVLFPLCCFSQVPDWCQVPFMNDLIIIFGESTAELQSEINQILGLMYGLIVYNSINHTVYDRKNNVMRDFCDNRNCSKMYKFGGNYTFFWHRNRNLATLMAFVVKIQWRPTAFFWALE